MGASLAERMKAVAGAAPAQPSPSVATPVVDVVPTPAAPVPTKRIAVTLSKTEWAALRSTCINADIPVTHLLHNLVNLALDDRSVLEAALRMGRRSKDK